MLRNFCFTLFVVFSFTTALVCVKGKSLNKPDSLLKHSYNNERDFDLPNAVLFELTTFALQVGRLGSFWDYPDGEIPLLIPLTWNYDKKTCIQDSCTVYNQQIQIGGKEYTTHFVGAHNNSAAVTFGLNNFTYILQIPNLSIQSLDFQWIETNMNTSSQLIRSKLLANIAKTEVGLKGDFRFSTETNVFQVSNLDVTLDLGKVRLNMPEVLYFNNGTWTELPAVDMDAAPEFNKLWKETDEHGETLKERYERFLEEKINSVLAPSPAKSSST